VSDSLAKGAVDACKASGYDVTVTILDADLSSRMVMRSDGARDGTVQIGYRKAYTVIKTGMSSAEFGLDQSMLTIALDSRFSMPLCA
jgi:uncharacterized protein GlcG (DUF336 family)